MFGNWKILEKERDLYSHIRNMLHTIINTHEISFITGEHMMIACLSSTSNFEEISDLLGEFLSSEISTYFLMPKPRKLSYRMNPILESHLFNKTDKRNVKEGKIDKKELKKLEKLFKQDKNREDMLREMARIMIHSQFPTDKDKFYHQEWLETQNIELELDSILDKISEKGLESLNEIEKEFLDNHKKK
tara:strand:+ start:473 stop:1039 length:567 start_codon:yes stop_codon:yes gene_type:complete